MGAGDKGPPEHSRNGGGPDAAHAAGHWTRFRGRACLQAHKLDPSWTLALPRKRESPLSAIFGTPADNDEPHRIFERKTILRNQA